MPAPQANATSRAELFRSQAPFNQIRNAVYHLIQFIQEQQIDAVEGLRRMGRDIARTFARYWTPEANDLTDVVAEIYRTVTGSKVKAEVTGDTVRVVDKKCRLCKYQQEGVDVAGCEIIASLVAEFTAQCQAQGLLSKRLESLGVEESRTRGDRQCVHIYRVLTE
ncbi:MAG TPA: hypothetical protein VKK79_18755 [Candidatus Lokiarchaeia archaeon]|nr:hypothetical protein [Candidatus Lokiarchaeia archaeon]